MPQDNCVRTLLALCAGVLPWMMVTPQVYAGGLAISGTPSLANGVVGSTYSQPLSATGGTDPCTWDVVPGEGPLPPSLTLEASTGVLSGMPTAAGAYTFTVRVTDHSKTQAKKSFSIVMAPSLSITTASLPDAAAGTAYSQTLLATGGTGAAYVWALLPVVGSLLPPGLSVSAGGVIAGTPTVPSIYEFKVQAADSTTPVPQKVTADLTITVSQALSVATASLPNGVAFASYPPAPYTPQALAANGGNSPYVWSASSPLPPGLIIGSSGSISGTPSAQGTFNVTFQVRDSSNPPQAISAPISITITPQLTITTPSLPNGVAPLLAYSQAITATGGTTPYTWSLSTGSAALPPGLTLNPASGTISGTPATPGSYTFAVQATDSSAPLPQQTPPKSFTILAVPALSGHVYSRDSRERNGIKGALVEATDPTSGATILSAGTNLDGYYILPLTAGTYNLQGWQLGYQPQSTQAKLGSGPQTQDFWLNPGRELGESYRMVLGGQQAGASSTPSVRKLFADVFLDIPGPGYHRGSDETPGGASVYGPHLRFWGNVRITSVPETAPIQLSQANLGSQVTSLNTSQIAQSVGFLFGPEYRLFGKPNKKDDNDEPLVTRNDNDYDLHNVTKFTGSLIAALGAVTPINPQSSATLVDASQGDVAALYKQLTGYTLTPLSTTCNTASTQGCTCSSSTAPLSPTCISALALLSKDRDRFMRQWFVGMRFKTHYFTSAGIPVSRSPATFDFSLGQNEEVTHGELQGMVFHMECFYPLPFEQLHMIYLFGRVYMRMKGSPGLAPSYALLPPQQTPAPTIGSGTVLSVPMPVPDRDIYSIGIGVDLVHVLTKLVKQAGP